MEEKIKQVIFPYQGITFEMSLRRTRKKKLLQKQEFVDVRHIYFFLMRRYTDYSFEKIGSVYRQTHSNVISGVNKVENLVSTDRDWKARIESYKMRLES